MKKFLIRLVINAVALYAAISFVPGIHAQNTNWVSLLVIALIFGIVNAIIRPIMTFLTCPLIIITLGLGTLLINTLMFYITGTIGTGVGMGFTVDGFWPAFFGALVVSVVSIFLSMIFHENRRDN
jgi:putative membrane protein